MRQPPNPFDIRIAVDTRLKETIASKLCDNLVELTCIATWSEYGNDETSCKSDLHFNALTSPK